MGEGKGLTPIDTDDTDFLDRDKGKSKGKGQPRIGRIRTDLEDQDGSRARLIRVDL
jgi:hypothetical protein